MKKYMAIKVGLIIKINTCYTPSKLKKVAVIYLLEIFGKFLIVPANGVEADSTFHLLRNTALRWYSRVLVALFSATICQCLKIALLPLNNNNVYEMQVVNKTANHISTTYCNTTCACLNKKLQKYMAIKKNNLTELHFTTLLFPKYVYQ